MLCIWVCVKGWNVERVIRVIHMALLASVSALSLPEERSVRWCEVSYEARLLEFWDRDLNQGRPTVETDYSSQMSVTLSGATVE